MNPRIKFLPGMAFGVSQPTMLLSLESAGVTEGEMRGLEKWLAHLLGIADLPQRRGGDLRSQFAYRLAWGVLAVQRAQGIPLPDALNPQAVVEGDYRNHAAQFALPYFFRETAAIAVRWFAAVVENRDWLLEWDAANRSHARCPDYGQLKAELDRTIPDISRLKLVVAAQSLDVPVTDLGFGIYLLGQACFSQRLDATSTEFTPGISISMAKNKLHTAALLRRAGLPAPRHIPVVNLQQAKDAARELGFPVVVKPWDRDRGEGVAAGLKSEKELASAIRAALKLSPNLLVERHYDGFTHRLTVFRGKVIKISQRRPGGVTGDGARSIEDLVAMEQATEDMQRRARHRRRLLLELDDEALDMLAAAGYAPGSVPPAGQFVPLRRRDNVSTGGSNMLMNPESVDPENIRLAAEAARVMRLDLAGVDVLSRDMGRPWYDNGAVICEVNAQPQLGDGTTPGIYQEILQELLGKQCRIPVHMLIVAAPAEQSAQSMESRAKTLGCNGHVLGCEVWVEGSRACGRHRNRFQAAVALLEHTSCRGALCLMSPADIVEFGLPTDRFEQVLLERAVKRQPGFEHLLAMIRPHAGDVRFMDEPQ